MILGDTMSHLAKATTDDKLFNKWVLEKKACLDKDYLPRFSMELSSVKKLRKEAKKKNQKNGFSEHMTLVFLFYWEMRDDMRVETYGLIMAHSVIMLMQETSAFMPEELGEALRNFDFLKIFMHWQNSVFGIAEMEKINGSENNDLENSSEFA